MIVGYHRAKTISQALELIARAEPRTLPLGGGTHLSRTDSGTIEVVDLQALRLAEIRTRGDVLEIGATAALEALHRHEKVPNEMRRAIELEAPLNLRCAATVAGSLIVADGGSTLGLVLLAMDAVLQVAETPVPARALRTKTMVGRGQGDRSTAGGSRSVSLGAFLAVRDEPLGGLITSVDVALNVRLAFEFVARTPRDIPIVSIALAAWPSGRLRAAVGGFGPSPLLSLDGQGAEGIGPAVRNSLHSASDDRASAEYRMEVAEVLSARCAHTLGLTVPPA